jgi:hypothetical protein
MEGEVGLGYKIRRVIRSFVRLSAFNFRRTGRIWMNFGVAVLRFRTNRKS